MILRNSKLTALLGNTVLGQDGIYSGVATKRGSAQALERELRERVAVATYKNYLSEVGKNHSVQVMDVEVKRFLEKLPLGAVVLDIGGCWGWHWRQLSERRPDVGVVIVDFVRANLHHAKSVLGALVGTQVALLEADATALPLPDATSACAFDGIWTVQTFQHIPDFEAACREARRVLKSGGQFWCYSLHRTPLNRLVYRALGRHFHVTGVVEGRFYLERASDSQREVIARVFSSKVVDRYSECLFHPDLRLSFTGAPSSIVGRLDARLSGSSFIARLLARQRSFEVIAC